MMKNYLYAGVAILAISIVLFFATSQFVTIGSPTQSVNVTALQGGIAYVPIHMNASSVAVVGVEAAANVNIYLLNQSVFSGLVSYLSANSMRSGYAYVSNAMVSANDIFLNSSTTFISVYQATQNESSNYTDYAVVDNSRGSYSTNSSVFAIVVYKSYNYSSSLNGSLVFLIPVAGIILGLALIVYGAIKKPIEEIAPVEEPKSGKKKKRGS
jgi:hypothetical protein